MSNILRNSGSRTDYLNSLRNKVKEMSSPKGQPQNFQKNDERFWKLDVDKAGTGSAVIRFLPPKAGDSFPFVQVWSHGFQGPTGKWVIDNCPSSLGGIPSDVCPVCKDNTRLYNMNKDKNCPHKKVASERKRKLSYISNILVIKDPKHPENEGKVFLYKYGKKIFEKITFLIDPPAEFADMEPVDPFDMEAGANFKLRQVKQDGFPNYDKSEFASPSPIGDEDFMSNIESQLFTLSELLDPKLFKTYDKLNERFTAAVGNDEAESSNDEAPATAPRASAATATSERAPRPAPNRTPPPAEVSDDDDGEASFLANLAAQTEE